MNKKGCLIGFLIATLLIVGFIAVVVIDSIVNNPTVDGLRYSLEDDGTFTVKGFVDGEETKELEIPAEVKGKPVGAIDDRAFNDETKLEKVTIPSSVKTLNGFSGCTNLKEVKISKGVVKIEQDAFANCTALTKIVIPEGVTNMEGNVFKGCTNLKEVVLPESLTQIYTGVFEGCTSLTSFSWPVSVKTIEQDMFKDCTNLSDIKIPEGVETLYGAFDGCTSLTELTIPSSVTDVWSFSDCENLVKITYKGTKEQWESMHGSQVVNGKCTVYCTDGTLSDLD